MHLFRSSLIEPCKEIYLIARYMTYGQKEASARLTEGVETARVSKTVSPRTEVICRLVGRLNARPPAANALK